MKERLPFRLLAVLVAVLLAALGIVGWRYFDAVENAEQAEPLTEWTFVSEPDLAAPLIDVSRYAVPGVDQSSDDDPILLAPKESDPLEGPLIVEPDGDPIWIGPQERAYDLRVQEYQGEPVLTYWRGDTPQPTYGTGDFVIMNTAYEEIATVTTQGIMRADYHEMTLTDEGTALMIGRRLERRNLTAKGGPRVGWIADNIVQEVDVETGAVLFEWSSLEHIPVSEAQVGLSAYGAGTRQSPFDYSHLNSVTEDGDGFLISARNTNAIYRVDRETGEVDWRLNGKNSDFTMLGNSRFAWQHDAQRQPDGTITLFDNQAGPARAKQSRGLRLRLDLRSMTARVVTEYLPPDERLSNSQGNLHVRPNGNVFIGWGEEPYFSEYTPDGELLLDGDFGSGESYRAYRLPWVGAPAEPPALTISEGTAYASWNGATEVAAWRFLAGEDAGSARDVGTVRQEGFETSAEVPDEPYIAVQALDADGRVLATAEASG